MAGQTTVTMVLTNTTTEDKGRTDLPGSHSPLLWPDVGEMLMDNHDLYPPSSRPHLATLADAELKQVHVKAPSEPTFPKEVTISPQHLCQVWAWVAQAV